MKQLDEDNLDRERLLFDLGPNPSRAAVHDALQKIAADHLTKHAAELLARVPKEEALRIMNDKWLPQMNEWIAEQCDLIMRTLPQHETASYADLCVKEMRRHVH
jgi:hypothetical protein